MCSLAFLIVLSFHTFVFVLFVLLDLIKVRVKDLGADNKSGAGLGLDFEFAALSIKTSIEDGFAESK